MRRKYNRAPGSRRYHDYTDETLENALTEVVEERMSQAQA